MRSTLKYSFAVVILAALPVLGGSQRKSPVMFCTSDSKDSGLVCMCLMYHPDFCSEEGPLPSCCRATEKNSKATGGCHCCGSGKKAATVVERGMYIDDRLERD